MFFHSLRLEFWRTRNNIYPTIVVEQKNNVTAADDTPSEQDHILPCIQRLQRLEKTFEELSHKPADIPLEKEKMLMGSLDRIKSIEFDLEKTKRVFLYTSLQSSTTSGSSDYMMFNCLLFDAGAT